MSINYFRLFGPSVDEVDGKFIIYYQGEVLEANTMVALVDKFNKLIMCTEDCVVDSKDGSSNIEVCNNFNHPKWCSRFGASERLDGKQFCPFPVKDRSYTIHHAG